MFPLRLSLVSAKGFVERRHTAISSHTIRKATKGIVGRSEASPFADTGLTPPRPQSSRVTERYCDNRYSLVSIYWCGSVVGTALARRSCVKRGKIYDSSWRYQEDINFADVSSIIQRRRWGQASSPGSGGNAKMDCSLNASPVQW